MPTCTGTSPRPPLPCVNETRWTPWARPSRRRSGGSTPGNGRRDAERRGVGGPRGPPFSFETVGKSYAGAADGGGPVRGHGRHEVAVATHRLNHSDVEHGQHLTRPADALLRLISGPRRPDIPASGFRRGGRRRPRRRQGGRGTPAPGRRPAPRR